MAFVLLISGGLLLRSFQKLTNLPPGFDPSNILTFSVALPANRYQRTTDVGRFVAALLNAMRRLPSVTYAASGTSLPVDTTHYTVISRPEAPSASAGFKPVAIYTVSPDYLSAVGIILKRGRSLQSSDRESGLPVALVNEAMARQYWSDSEILGRQIQWIGGGPRDLTVVGVVADVHQDRLDGPILPALYVPLAQSPQPVRNLIFVARTLGSPLSIANGIRQAVRSVDRTLPIFALQTAEQRLARSIAPRRFTMFLLVVFAGSALALAALGLYAVTSYLVSQCSRELGISDCPGCFLFSHHRYDHGPRLSPGGCWVRNRNRRRSRAHPVYVESIVRYRCDRRSNVRIRSYTSGSHLNARRFCPGAARDRSRSGCLIEIRMSHGAFGASQTAHENGGAFPVHGPKRFRREHSDHGISRSHCESRPCDGLFCRIPDATTKENSTKRRDPSERFS